MKDKSKWTASRASNEGSEIKVRRGTESEKARRTPSEVEASFEEMLHLPELSPPVQAGSPYAEVEPPRVTRHEWEKPDPSTIWRGAGGISIAIGAAAIIAFLTVPNGSSSRISLPLAIGIGGAIVALVCGIAHYDVNRGRHPRRSEIMDEVRSGDRETN